MGSNVVLDPTDFQAIAEKNGNLRHQEHYLSYSFMIKNYPEI